MNHSDFDITQNIKIIEVLKSQLLSKVAGLYECMLKNTQSEEREESLSDILITTYLLSARLSVDYETLEKKVLNKLRVKMLSEDEQLNKEFDLLYQHIASRI